MGHWASIYVKPCDLSCKKVDRLKAIVHFASEGGSVHELPIDDDASNDKLHEENSYAFENE